LARGRRSSELVLRRGMGGGCGTIPRAAAAIRRLIRVAIVPRLLRGLPCRDGAVASPADRAQCGWIRDLPLQAGQLQIVCATRLLETILPVCGRRPASDMRPLWRISYLSLTLQPGEHASGSTARNRSASTSRPRASGINWLPVLVPRTQVIRAVDAEAPARRRPTCP